MNCSVHAIAALNQDNHTIIGSALSDLRKRWNPAAENPFQHQFPLLASVPAHSRRGGFRHGATRAVIHSGCHHVPRLSFGIYLFASSVKLWRARQWFRRWAVLVNLPSWALLS